MSTTKDYLHARNVLTITEDAWTVIPPLNKVWVITEFIADCIPGSDTVVCLIWDYQGPGESILFTAHGPSTYEYTQEIIGDGVKELAIVLSNFTADTESMMGIIKAKEL